MHDDATEGAATAAVYMVRLQNTARTPRRGWLEVGIPPQVCNELLADPGAMGLQLDVPGVGIVPMRRGRALPDVVFWHGLATLPAGADLQARLQVRGEVNWTNQGLHPYLAEPGDLDLQVHVRWRTTNHPAGPEQEAVATLVPLELPTLGAKMRRRYFARVPGTPLHVEGYLQAWPDQPQARLVLSIGYSGGTTGDLAWQAQAVWLTSKEAVVIDNEARIGGGSGPTGGHGVGWAVLLSGPRWFARGRLVPYRGWLCGLPQGANTPIGNDEHLAGTLQAMQAGECWAATFMGWDGHYSSCGPVPLMPRAWGDGQAVADAAWRNHLRNMRTVGDMYDDRPMGLQQLAGSTGAQDDFGAVQDVLALRLADGRRTAAMLWNVDEWFLRPCHNREQDGSAVRFARHPGLRTWSQVPEARVGASDLVGWPADPYVEPWPVPFSGIDDQHRSQHLLHCVMHLVDCDSLQDCLADHLQMDLANAMYRNGWVDQPRAVGRLAAAWAGMLGLLEREQDRVDLEAMASLWLSLQWERSEARRLPGAAVRPLTVGASPDIGNRTAPCVVVWEHSIAAMGLYALWRRTALPMARQLALLCAELVTRWGAIGVDLPQPTEQQLLVLALAFRWQQDGSPLPPSSYRTGSPDVALGDGAWWDWCLPGVLVLLDLGGPGHDLHGWAMQVARQVWGAGPQTQQAAEWWALVPGLSLPGLGQ